MIGIIKKIFNRQNNYYIELEDGNSQQSSSQQNGNQGNQQFASQQQPQQAKQSASSSQTSSTGNRSAQQSSISVEKNGQSTMAEQQLQQEQAFAPSFLTPQAKTPRRRPGANMSEYMDLARQVNLPRMQ